MKMILFLGKFRKVIYFPYQKKLLTAWYGKIPEEEYAEHLDYLEELIDSYEIRHLVFDTKKAQSHFFKPSLRFVEKVLNKAIQNGAEKLTMVQKRFGNRQHVEDIYRTALNIHNLDVRVNVIEPTSYPVQDGFTYSQERASVPIQFSAQKLQARFSPLFG